MSSRLPVLVAALWWGGLTVLGGLVVPLLFTHLPTPAMAGQMAGQLFSAQTWVSASCGLLLLVFSRAQRSPGLAEAGHRVVGLALAGMLLALLAEFAVAPRIVARDNLRLWHSVGSAMYLLQWGCAAGALWRLSARRH